MKYVIEFGVRGGAHTENYVVNTCAGAEKLAASMVMVFCNSLEAHGAKIEDWAFSRHCKRKTWASETHFVAVSKLDGVMRGPAASILWKKQGGSFIILDSVLNHY